MPPHVAVGHLQRLADELRVPPGGDGSFLSQALKANPQDPAQWDRLADWLDERTTAYQAAFRRERTVPSPG